MGGNELLAGGLSSLDVFLLKHTRLIVHMQLKGIINISSRDSNLITYCLQMITSVHLVIQLCNAVTCNLLLFNTVHIYVRLHQLEWNFSCVFMQSVIFFLGQRSCVQCFQTIMDSFEAATGVFSSPLVNESQ